MSKTKEYYLKLSEEKYNMLPNEEKLYLNYLGMQVKQLPNDDDLLDEHYKSIKKAKIDAHNKEQEYLFKKRNQLLLD